MTEAPIPTPWLTLLEAARRYLRAFREDGEAQALLDLAAAIGEVEAWLERQHGLQPPEWLDRH